MSPLTLSVWFARSLSFACSRAISAAYSSQISHSAADVSVCFDSLKDEPNALASSDEAAAASSAVPSAFAAAAALRKRPLSPLRPPPWGGDAAAGAATIPSACRRLAYDASAAGLAVAAAAGLAVAETERAGAAACPHWSEDSAGGDADLARESFERMPLRGALGLISLKRASGDDDELLSEPTAVGLPGRFFPGHRQPGR